MPAIKAALEDDFGIMPWPAFDAEGTQATFWGGWSEMVNGKSQHIEEAKAFVKWLWIEQTELQQDWNLSYGFHVPPRNSAAAAAEPLKDGAAAEAVQYFYDHGRIMPAQWTASMESAVTTAMSAIVTDGAPAAEQVASAAEICEAELQSLLGG